MRKEYVAPELEIIEFISSEEISNGDVVGGEEEYGSIPEGWE